MRRLVPILVLLLALIALSTHTSAQTNPPGTVGNVMQVAVASPLKVGYGPVNVGGGPNFVTGALPVANVAPGSNGQFLQTSGGAVTWGSAPAGGISQLTGQVTAGPGSGSQAATIAPGTNGQVLVTNATPASVWGAVNLASASAVTGTLPAGNQAAQTIGGDGSGTTSSLTINQAKGGASGSGVVFGSNGQVDGYFAATDSWQIASLTGAANDMAIWLGSGNIGNGSEFALNGGTASTQMNSPIGGTLYLSIGGYSSTTGTSISGGAWTFGTSQTLTTGGIVHMQSSGADMIAAGPTGGGLSMPANVINATSGSVNVSSAQASHPAQKIQATLTNTLTIGYPNVEGYYFFNLSLLGLAGHGVVLECGTPGSTYTIGVSSPLFPICYCDGANNFYCG